MCFLFVLNDPGIQIYRSKQSTYINKNILIYFHFLDYVVGWGFSVAYEKILLHETWMYQTIKEKSLIPIKNGIKKIPHYVGIHSLPFQLRIPSMDGRYVFYQYLSLRRMF